MNSLHPVSENPPPELTKAFWPSVRFFIETIWALFGGPETIAAMHNLARSEHQLLASWLRKAEALVRRLLAIEAADVELVETKFNTRAPVMRQKIRREFYADEPHFWRVSFRVSEGTCTFSTAKRYAAPSSDARFPSSWPLAERFEALLRVFDAPENYIRRTARLMRRKIEKLDALLSVPLIDGFEEVFEPLRQALCGALDKWRRKRDLVRDTT